MTLFSPAEQPASPAKGEDIMTLDVNRADMKTIPLEEEMPDGWRDDPQTHALVCVVQNRPTALRQMLASGLVDLHKEAYLQLKGFPDRIPLSLVQAACIWKKAEPLRVLLMEFDAPCGEHPHQKGMQMTLNDHLQGVLHTQKGIPHQSVPSHLGLDCGSVVLEKGAVIDFDYFHGERIPLLTLACERGEPPLVRMLLDHGANPNICKRDAGSGPVYKAAQHGHVDCLALLIGVRADLDAQFRTGATPLLIAAFGGHDKCVHALLAAGADPSIRACDGGTALSTAVQLGFSRCITLLEAGAAALSHDPADPFLVGEPVVLAGLKAKPELNGKQGRVVDWVAARGRYGVLLSLENCEEASEPMALKPDNLRRAAMPPGAPRTVRTPVTLGEIESLLRTGQYRTAKKLASRGDVDVGGMKFFKADLHTLPPR